MQNYEYKVEPAPKRGLKAKGLKTGEARFANALQQMMNEFGAEGWEYQRTDTLPLEERQGLTGKTTSFQNMLVFRRPLPVAQGTPVAVMENGPEAALSAPEEEDITAADGTCDDRPNAPEPAMPAAPDQRAKGAIGASDFVFPWASRKAKAAAKEAPDDKRNDPQVAAE